jgi:hypothetical protein|nr:hypothetical protein [Kofleriaceae bacterium]
MVESSERALTADEAAYIAAARDKAFVLYEGARVAHRSCGIALAETFNLPTPAYQALRRGGITGKGACGAIRAGEQVLGELLGDPDPRGMVTPALRDAVVWYQAAWKRLRFADDPQPAAPDITCDRLVRPHGEFTGPARKAFCTSLAADVAALAAEALCRFAPAARPAIVPVRPDEESR